MSDHNTNQTSLYKTIVLVKIILEKNNYGKILAKCSKRALHEYLS